MNLTSKSTSVRHWLADQLKLEQEAEDDWIPVEKPKQDKRPTVAKELVDPQPATPPSAGAEVSTDEKTVIVAD